MTASAEAKSRTVELKPKVKPTSRVLLRVISRDPSTHCLDVQLANDISLRRIPQVLPHRSVILRQPAEWPTWRS
jgi:hypothetical protein